MSKEIATTNTSVATIEKPKSSVALALEKQELSLGQEVAMRALKLVQPMIESVSKELTDSLGDNETIIVIKVTGAGKPATITMLDTHEDFTIQGAKANKQTSNKLRDAYIKQMHHEGKLSDEQYQAMNISDNKFIFTGEQDPITKKPKARKQFYVIEAFVDALLTGKMENITKQLIKSDDKLNKQLNAPLE